MEDITIKEYSRLDEVKRFTYDVLNGIEQKQTFNDVRFNIDALTWSEVKGVIKTLTRFDKWDSVVDIYETCFKIDKELFWSSSIIEYFSTKRMIVETFINLKKREIELLKSSDIDSMLWEQAGGSRLDRFADILPLKQLGTIYGVYPIELGKKPYNEILALLVMHKTDREVNEKYDNLKSEIKKHIK